jgi:hypothetical protein
MRKTDFNNVAAIGVLGLIAAYYATGREVAQEIAHERDKTSRCLRLAEVP